LPNQRFFITFARLKLKIVKKYASPYPSMYKLVPEPERFYQNFFLDGFGVDYLYYHPLGAHGVRNSKGFSIF